MGLRHDILAALALKHPEVITLDDLMDATGETNRARLASNLKAAQADALIDLVRDDVTNLPAYRLTPTGKIMLGDLAGAVKTLADALDAATAERAKYAKRAHDLGNDAAGANLILHAIREKLDIDDDANLLDALDASLGLAAESDTPAGKLALLLIDSDAMTDIEELDTADLVAAANEARRQIDVGNAARAVVIRIHGEAYRRTEWKEAA